MDEVDDFLRKEHRPHEYDTLFKFALVKTLENLKYSINNLNYRLYDISIGIKDIKKTIKKLKPRKFRKK